LSLLKDRVVYIVDHFEHMLEQVGVIEQADELVEAHEVMHGVDQVGRVVGHEGGDVVTVDGMLVLVARLVRLVEELEREDLVLDERGGDAVVVVYLVAERDHVVGEIVELSEVDGRVALDGARWTCA